MGENNEQRRKVTGVRIPEEPPSIPFGNFTVQEIGDELSKIRVEICFSECYADWPQLQTLLKDHLLSPPPPAELAILVPACGYSRLSEHLYDAGFMNIMNVDSSEVVISDMWRRNLEQRPQMKWRVMDMTDMQFDHGTFDAIIDKGGLDALMEVRQRTIYLSEVCASLVLITIQS